MLIAKSLAWIILYPLVLFGFVFNQLMIWIKFLFNSPVDIWEIVSKAIEEAAKE